jgi:uncharacterized membrane protein YdbT with pleckstrin-like domain
MSELIVRPSMKFIRFGYWTAILIFFAAVFVYINYLMDRTPAWLLILPGLLLLWPAKRHIKQRFTMLTISGDKLRYETGMFSKSMRTIQISKVQDVRVDQGALQLLCDVGNVSIETAGEASRLTMSNVDHPREIADQISGATRDTESKPPKEKK